MLESSLYFILGFLSSVLLALMVAPAIWRRAVFLTRKRIENSVPLTIDEIQADKDQLRAEFAITTRRLEVGLDKVKQTAAKQLIKLSRNRDEMLSLEATKIENSARILELEEQAIGFHTEAEIREEQLSQTSATLTGIQNKLEEQSLSFSKLDQKYKSAVDDFDGQKIEMVARETRLDTIQGEAQNTRNELKSKITEQKESTKNQKSLAASLKKQERINLALNEKLTRFQSQFADMESRLERRDTDIAKLRKSGNNDSKLTKLEEALDKSLAKKLKFEEKFKTLKEELGTSPSSDNPSTARIENKNVRERISDLAAKVTAMTASIEGPDSPVNTALAKDNKTLKRKSKLATKSKGSMSLAERIHALQNAAEKA